MTEKDLKKLGRRELLELLLIQTQRADELEKMLSDTKKRLSEKSASVNANNDPGNIAEAALKINGVFETAQAAATQYLDNIESCSDRCDKMLMETQKHCEEVERQTAEKILQVKNELERVLADFGSSPEAEGGNIAPNE